ncbi:MAG: hypothetical protein ABI678_06090 [Kofleriaceae bacterium]
MRWLSIAVVVAACSKTPAEPADKPHHHEDRHAVQTAPTAGSLAVKIGDQTVTWDAAAFARVAKIDGKASDGEARDTWSLRELAHTLVGPDARVTAVIGADGPVALDAAAWADATRTPILHSTRRGTLKFRWTDAAGKWGDTAAKDVSGLEIQPR